jgi:hypothetical protein
MPMRSFFVALLGLAFVLVPLSMANTPANDTSLNAEVDLRGALVEITITQTDSLAKSGIDTCVVQILDVAWMQAGNANAMVTGINTLNDGAAGDSVSVVIQGSIDGTAWTSDVAAYVLNGQVAAEKDPAVLAKFWRFLITNNDDVKHPYTFRVIAPRAR